MIAYVMEMDGHVAVITTLFAVCAVTAVARHTSATLIIADDNEDHTASSPAE